MPPDLFLPGGDHADDFFLSSHGRTVAALSETYPLPVDADEVKRSELHHRLIQFVFSGKNYIGPVKEALQFGQKRKILDLGTGGGHWAIDMADEFPRADVIGIDVAPIQPQYVPPNCEFEICNLDEPLALPYPSESFDLIHARSIHIGIRNYPRLLQEIGRLLRPGGLVLLVEPDLFPAAEQSLNPNETEGQEDGNANEFRPPDPTNPTRASSTMNGREFPTEREAQNRNGSLATPVAASTVSTATPSRQLSSGFTDVGVDVNAIGGDGSRDAPPSTMETRLREGPEPTASSETLRGQLQSRPQIASVAHTLPTAAPPASSSTIPPSSSQSPVKRATTINRRHLDFILNPVPQPPPQANILQSARTGEDNDNARFNAVVQHTLGTNPYPSIQISPVMRGWSKLWSTFRDCLEHPRRAGVDVSVPPGLGALLVATDAFENVVVKRANVPIGFWPTDPNLLTIGQLQWMDYELLIPALRFAFLSNQIPYDEVEHIIRDAQHDLYNPPVPFFAYIHIAYASKRR